MTGSIGSSMAGSARGWKEVRGAIPFPGTISSIETLAIICKLKSPPSCHAGQFPPAHAIVLASCRYGSEQVEKVEDDAFPGFVIDAEGYEGIKSMSGEV